MKQEHPSEKQGGPNAMNLQALQRSAIFESTKKPAPTEDREEPDNDDDFDEDNEDLEDEGEGDGGGYDE